MRTKSVIYSSVVSLLIAIAVYNEGFSQQVEICATCPGNDVLGHKASAFGVSNIASGSYSFVAGLQSEASKPNSVVIGSWSKATGDNSFVIGNFSHALAVDSYVFGNNSTSEFDFSMALGHNILSRNGAFVLGNGRVDAKLTNNHQESLMIGFNSPYPTLFVSRTPVGYQSGRIGIGNITSPEAKLHIRADTQEDANLMLQATGLGKKAMLLFNGGPGMISNLDPSAPLQFYAGGGRYLGIHLDGETGNIGIGLDNPSAQLDINGQLRIRGGSPATGKVLTSNADGLATWETPSGGGGSNWTVNGSHIYRLNGNVGIGTSNPREKLSIDAGSYRPINFHIGGSQNIYSNAYYDGSNKRAKAGPAYAINFSDSRMAFRVAGNGAANSQITWNEVISLNTDGNVGIGTTDPKGYKLAVKGKIITEEVVVKLSGSWPDYVFQPTYQLMGIHEVGNFIEAHGHLPEVPNAQQVAEEGISIGEMNAVLLRKIEELTLYTLQQQKEIDALKSLINK